MYVCTRLSPGLVSKLVTGPVMIYSQKKKTAELSINTFFHHSLVLIFTGSCPRVSSGPESTLSTASHIKIEDSGFARCFVVFFQKCKPTEAACEKKFESNVGLIGDPIAAGA